METKNGLCCCTLCDCPFSSDAAEPLHAESTDNLNVALPVQSARCSHILCLACVQQQTLAIRNDNGDAESRHRSVRCPICWQEDAFNAKEPIISTMTCSLLQQLQSLSSAQPPKDNEDSTHKMIVPDGKKARHKDCYVSTQEAHGTDQPGKQDSKVALHEPDIFVCEKEPQLTYQLPHSERNGDDLSSSSSEESRHRNPAKETDTSPAHTSSTGNQTIQSAPVRPSSLPGAFPIPGIRPRLNENNTESPIEDLVQAYLVVDVDPLPTPEINIVHAEPLVSFFEKHQRLFRGLLFVGVPFIFLGVIFTLAVILPGIIKEQQRATSFVRIVLEESNKSSVKDLGLSQALAKNWILGSNNMQFDPKKDRDRISQRYLLATLFYSMGGENWENTFCHPIMSAIGTQKQWLVPVMIKY